ncbi:SDR family NAD(P)-dependent oxidoreductase [Nocardiopsis trehalosi]|uniref:SDR family NAD(P)-dependent oxidoreductase n=1 Tax=Nocardiopsis trehalosi TaxID=109329 RepID=UPI0008360983|nr:SDR family oxidoreductase [Nocardiopsis trehalosi]
MAQRMVVVTGGASGIGRAAVRLVGAAGVPVAVLDTDAAAARAAAEEAVAAGAPDAAGLRCDVTDEGSVQGAVDAARERFGAPPTGLVAAAGVDIGGPAHLLPVADWRRVLEVNLTGAYLAARCVVAALLDSGAGGSLVLCSSPAASVAFAAGGTGAYAASKGGVSALVRALAVDYAAAGIRVNAIVPGPTETALMWASVPEAERGAMRATLCAEVPMGRLADPEEPARAALWLLGPDSSYVTGSHLVCDGGVLAKGSVSV